VTFSNGDPLNAYDVWFSFVRELYLGQAVGISNYYELTVEPNTTSSGYILPWGIRHAIQAATGLPATTNINLTVSVLNSMLSNFNPANATQREIMGYPNQAYVVLSPMSFRINLLHPYPYFLQVIAAWWGAVVDPAYVDAHGGVQANTQNSYFDANSGPTTGPYVVRSVGPGFSDIVLEANPNYWAKYVENPPYVAQPAHIKYVVINYGLPHQARVEAFATNQAQISYVSVPFLSQMYSSYQYRQYFAFKQIFFSFGLLPGLFYVSMNTQRPPTNNNYFRLAIVHAVNYTLILDKTYMFNGTLYASLMLGPISPGLPLYNPDNLPLYSYNPRLAAYYLNLAGQQEGFSVTLPNGTIIGNTSAPPLQPLTITYIAPLTPLVDEQLLIIQGELAQIGIAVGAQGVTASEALSWTDPQSTPNFVYDSWVPDWVDPILQLVAPAITTSSYLPAWVNLSTINQIMNVLPFTTNQTQRLALTATLYNITYNYAPYIWLPDPYEYYFIQPYVHGLVGDPLFGYWYNTLYYSNTT
jgi:ABC-type transport system substrate-binding protein